MAVADNAPGGSTRTAPARKSVHVAGLEHGSLPIPAASVVGPFIATGGVRGVDPETGKMPEDPATQVRLMFDNLERIVEAGGGSRETILKVTVFSEDRSLREHLNTEWLRLFPDEASRPARHMQTTTLPGGMLVQCEALAVAF